MKYKVGDKVRVKENLPLYMKARCVSTFSPETLEYNGMIVTVSEVKKDQYKIEEDNGFYDWYEDMLEPVEEMSAEEALKTYTEFCSEHSCNDCPIQKLDTTYYCPDIRKEYPEDVVKVLKQWKADHEKKPIETEFACVVRVIEDTGKVKRCVYEEDVTEEKGKKIGIVMKKVLEEYCKEHEGKFFTVYEEICRVKE